MRTLVWLKVILFGAAGAVLLSIVSLIIDDLIRPDRELLFLNLKYVVYLIVPLVAAAGGLIVSLAVLISRSLLISVIVAVIVALTISTGLIKGAVEICSRADHFDAPMFYADVVQIILALFIYPAICLLIWNVFRKNLISNS